MKFKDPSSQEELEVFDTDELRGDLQVFFESKCAHADTRLCKVEIRGGGTQLREQCQTCGSLVGSAKKQDEATARLGPKNDALEKVYRHAREKGRIDILLRHWHLQNERESEWWKAYRIYLNSPEWRHKAQLVKDRSGGRCEGCGAKSATQVHHRSYANRFDEFLFELVAVCDLCHDKLHRDSEHELPCSGCRFSGEQFGVEWCCQFEIPAKAALSLGGRCGPGAKALDPLR